MTSIPEAVFDHFAADPIGPSLSLGYVADDVDSPIRSRIEGFLSSIDADRVAAARQDQPMVIEVEQLEDNLYVLRGRGGGGNTAVFATTAGVAATLRFLPTSIS